MEPYFVKYIMSHCFLIGYIPKEDVFRAYDHLHIKDIEVLEESFEMNTDLSLMEIYDQIRSNIIPKEHYNDAPNDDEYYCTGYFNELLKTNPSRIK